MHVLSLSAGTAIRRHILPKPMAAGFHHTVVGAAPPREATLDAFVALLTEPGGMAALLTHDHGVAWTEQAEDMLPAATNGDDEPRCMAQLRHGLEEPVTEWRRDVASPRFHALPDSADHAMAALIRARLTNVVGDQRGLPREPGRR